MITSYPIYQAISFMAIILFIFVSRTFDKMIQNVLLTAITAKLVSLVYFYISYIESLGFIYIPYMTCQRTNILHNCIGVKYAILTHVQSMLHNIFKNAIGLTWKLSYTIFSKRGNAEEKISVKVLSTCPPKDIYVRTVIAALYIIVKNQKQLFGWK